MKKVVQLDEAGILQAIDRAESRSYSDWIKENDIKEERPENR